MKLLVFCLSGCIVAMLVRELLGLLNSQPHSQSLLRSLIWRISLSLGLFMLLLVGALFGWWRPRGTQI